MCLLQDIPSLQSASEPCERPKKGINGDCVFPTRVLCISLGKDDPVRLSHFIEKKMMLKEAMTCSETFDLLVTRLESDLELPYCAFSSVGRRRGSPHSLPHPGNRERNE